MNEDKEHLEPSAATLPPALMLAMRSPNRIVRIPGKTRGSAATPPFPLPSLRLYGLGGGTSEPRDRCSPALRLTLGFVVADDLGAPFRFVVRASSQTQPCQCQFFKFPLALGIAHAFRGHGARMSDIRHEAKRPFMSFLFVRLGHPRHRVAPFEDAACRAELLRGSVIVTSLPNVEIERAGPSRRKTRIGFEVFASRYDEIAEAELKRAPPYFFRCPITGSDVQGFLVEEAPGDDPNSYTAVCCLACGQTHLVNFTTGNTVGGDVEASGGRGGPL